LYPTPVKTDNLEGREALEVRVRVRFRVRRKQII